MRRIILGMIAVLFSTAMVARADIVPGPRPPKPIPRTLEEVALEKQDAVLELATPDSPATVEISESTFEEQINEATGRADENPNSRLSTIVAGLAMSAAVVSAGLFIARRRGRALPTVVLLTGILGAGSIVLANKAPTRLPEPAEEPKPTTEAVSGVGSEVTLRVVKSNRLIVQRLDRTTLAG